jgi:hypothetical protein
VAPSRGLEGSHVGLAYTFFGQGDELGLGRQQFGQHGRLELVEGSVSLVTDHCGTSGIKVEQGKEVGLGSRRASRSALRARESRTRKAPALTPRAWAAS